MSDCLGGYTFFNERFDGPNEVCVTSGEDGKLIDWIPTVTPRYVNRGEVTKEVFGDSKAKILEINSKTGLYPLYVAYSLYRQRTQDFLAANLIEDVDNYSVEEEQVIWDDILANNIYVICNTPMAQRITHRTLLGFRTITQKDGNERVNIKAEKLIERATTEKDSLINDLKSVGYWRGTRSKEDMKFSAVVGNPPYQIMDGGAQASARPVYQKFVEMAKDIYPSNISMIMPTRWYAGGKGLDEFRENMLNDKNIHTIHDFLSPETIFTGTNIRGGICYFLWSQMYDNSKDLVKVVTHESNGILREIKRPMRVEALDIFIRDGKCVSILNKVRNKHNSFFDNYISGLRPFEFRGYFVKDEHFRSSPKGLLNPVSCIGKGMQVGYVERSEIQVHQDWIDRYKVYMSRANNIGTEL